MGRVVKPPPGEARVVSPASPQRATESLTALRLLSWALDRYSLIKVVPRVGEWLGWWVAGLVGGFLTNLKIGET